MRDSRLSLWVFWALRSRRRFFSDEERGRVLSGGVLGLSRDMVGLVMGNGRGHCSYGCSCFAYAGVGVGVLVVEGRFAYLIVLVRERKAVWDMHYYPKWH